MTIRLPIVLPVIARLVMTASAQQPVPTGEFTKIQLTDQFWAEGATYGDFNHDGKMDVAYGPYWWEGPDFKVRHTFYPDTKTSKIKKPDGSEAEIAGYKGALSNENEYSDSF